MIFQLNDICLAFQLHNSTACPLLVDSHVWPKRDFINANTNFLSPTFYELHKLLLASYVLWTFV